MIESKYENGWEGFTNEDFKKMYSGCYNEWPVWATCKSGAEFDPMATLMANGFDPEKIPNVFKDKIIIGDILKEIDKTIKLTFIEIPER